MGVFESEDDNIPGPGGLDDLKIGLKMIEDVEKCLKDVKQYIKDPHYKNCKSMGSYLLETEIPNLLKRSLEYIGHSVTYKEEHNLLPTKNYQVIIKSDVDDSISSNTQKTLQKHYSEDLNNSENSHKFFFDKNSKIDVTELILNYLDNDDIESLNKLKQYSEIDFFEGMDRECEVFWDVHLDIITMVNHLKDLIKNIECSKVGINKMKKQFDKDIIGWFKEVHTAGRLLTFDTFDINTSRAVWAYNYYFKHPEIGEALYSQSFVLSLRRRLSINKDYYSDYSNLYQYRDKLYEEYKRKRELEALNAEWDRKYFAELRCRRG